jgi:hypothetical protein
MRIIVIGFIVIFFGLELNTTNRFNINRYLQTLIFHILLLKTVKNYKIEEDVCSYILCFLLEYTLIGS